METTRMRSSAIVLLLAGALNGCATTGQPSGQPKSGLSCDPITWPQAIPETVTPEKWEPRGPKRGYLHIRFVAEPTGIFAIVVPVVELQAENPVVVGPMENLSETFPDNEDEAHAMLAKTPHWQAFYRALFAAYRKWRPMGLVCPGKDCRKTPEAPPPPLAGMTTTYGGGTGALAIPTPDRALAMAEEKSTGAIGTDAFRVPPTGTRTPAQEAERQTVFQDTVARAVCAAQILARQR